MKSVMKLMPLLLGLTALVQTPTAIAADPPAKPAADKPAKYDIATFLNIGACVPTGFSSDGKDVYFTSGASGASQVYRLMENGWPYQLTTFEDGIESFNLSYDGTRGLVLASVGGNENAQIYLMDTKTGNLSPLTNRPDVQYGSASWARDDRSIFYRSNEENKTDFFIYRMDLATGAVTKIFSSENGVKGFSYIADLSKDGRKIIIGNATSNVNNDLYLLDLETGKTEQLNKDEGDVSYANVNLMPDNRTIWLTCNDNPDGITRLAKMTVGSSKVEYVNDGWLDPRWEIGGFGFDSDYKYMSAVLNEDGYFRLRLRDATTMKPLPPPPLDGMMGTAAWDRNGNCVFGFSGPTRAPDVWWWSPATKELKQLTFSIYAGIDRSVFRDPQLIRYKSFDGLEIPAFLYLPPDYVKGTPIPFVVDAHGGPEAQFQPGFIRNFQYLMLNGYGILAPNPRGSSGYGIKYLNLDNYKNRKDSLKDYKAGVDWLIQQGYTKQGMIGIRGGSYGGYVTLGMITEYPDLFSAAIDNVGIANFKTFLENTASYRRALRESEYGPLSDPEFLASISPIHKADQIRTPLLVIHGANDPRVPVDEARQMIRAIQTNGGIVDSLIFADEGHGSGKRVNTITEYRKQVSFLDTFLKPKELGEKKD